jgi:hypothetical protein
MRGHGATAASSAGATGEHPLGRFPTCAGRQDASGDHLATDKVRNRGAGSESLLLQISAFLFGHWNANNSAFSLVVRCSSGSHASHRYTVLNEKARGLAQFLNF